MTEKTIYLNPEDFDEAIVAYLMAMDYLPVTANVTLVDLGLPLTETGMYAIDIEIDGNDEPEGTKDTWFSPHGDADYMQ